MKWKQLNLKNFVKSKINPDLKYVYSENNALSIVFQSNELLLGVLGEFNSNLKELEKITNTSIYSRGNSILVKSDVEKNNIVKNAIQFLTDQFINNGTVEKKDIIYGCCKHVWRTFFWNSIKKYKNCSFIPIGYKSFDKVPKKKISEKKYLWSYLGTIHHASRYDLNYQLRKVEPSFVKKTQAFGSTDSLDSKSYYNILNDSIFIPVPIGFIHPETYRLFECLEIGCIPIVENPKKFFDMLFPNNPFIKKKFWS